MKKKVMALLALSISFAVASARAHTYDETNDVVYAALDRAAFYYDDLPWGAPPDNDPPPTTWRGFLGADTNGWTLAGKMAAFDWDLSTLATNDCETLDESDELYARVALGKCEWFNYTNSVNAMKALALNPKGVYREWAINLAVRFSPIDNNTTEFVETIITNISGYTSGERVGCYWEYAKKLQQDPCTNGTCASALSMFYRNRKVSGTGAATLDRLFSDKIAGYANSSNRLDTALSMLMVTNMRPQFIEYFVGVTNQLLSSGQPLPWINVGGGGN